MTNGTIIDATQICPRFASMPEMAFNCSEDSIYSDDNSAQNDVKDAEQVKVAFLREGMEIAVVDDNTEEMVWDKIASIEILSPEKAA